MASQVVQIQNRVSKDVLNFLRIGLLVVGLYRLFGFRLGHPLVNWENIRYFKPSEFDSPDEKGTGNLMAQTVVEICDYLRNLTGKPLYINSGFRTDAHNQTLIQKYGASPNSSHKKGLAVDLHCYDLEHMNVIIQALRKLDVKRIGQYISNNGNLFVHFDIDTTKTYKGEWCKIKGKKIKKRADWLIK